MSLEINQNLPQYSPEEEKEILSARIELWNQGILHWKLDVTQKKIYDFFFDNLSKVIVVNASRRLGKTYALAVIAIEMCIKNAKTYVDFIQPEVTMITNNVNPEVFEVLFEDCPLEIMPKFNPQKNYWLFPNGSRIKLAGTDNKNYNKLRGGSSHLTIIDEAGFCSDLNKIIKSIVIPKTLLTKGRVILASTTPDTPDHEFVDILQDAELKGSFIRKTIKDAIEEQKGTHLVRMTDEILQDILKSYVGGESNQEFQTEFMCVLPIDSNNSVISEFTHVEKDAVCLWPRPAYYDRYVGMDIGFDDLTFVIFGFWDFLNAVFYVEQEFIINGPALTSKVLAEEIDRIERELWTDPLTREKLPVYKRVSDNNKILINDLSKSPQKLYFIPTEKHDKDSFLNQMKVMMGGRQIKIHPRCKTLINHLKYATWNKNRTDFKRVTVDGQGHHHYDGVAALMYLVRNIDKNRNPYPKNYQHQSIIGNSDHYFIRPKDTDGESNNPSLNKLNKVLFKRNLSSFKK